MRPFRPSPNRRVDRERRAVRQRAARRLLRLGASAVVLGALGFQAFRMADARGWLSPFRIREVRVVGAAVAHPRVLVAEAGLMGRSVSWWSPLGIYAERVERDPLVAEARFVRSFPNRLTLVVEERSPIVHVQLDRLTPVDTEGRVLPVSAFQEGWDVPVIALGWKPSPVIAEGVLRPGPVREVVALVTRVRDAYPDLYREISALELERSGKVTLQLMRAEGVIVLDLTTPVEKLSLIDDVIGDLRRKGISYGYLDLRFEDQIVVQKG